MKDDFDFIETKVDAQYKQMNAFLQQDEINKHSVTVLEVGAGPSQPLAREFGQLFYTNDKYRCCLIRINPIKERTSQYKREKELFDELIAQHSKRTIDGSPELIAPLTEVPDFRQLNPADMRGVVLEEEQKYAALKNELIEIELPAKDGLWLLMQTLIKQKRLMRTARPRRGIKL